MQRHPRLTLTLIGLSLAIAGTWMAQISHAYVEAPMSLGAIIAQSTNIVLMRVESVDKDKNIIVYRKVRDIKGKHPQDVIKHNIGRGGLRANEWKPQMDWAEPGKTAVFFHNGGASETCIGTWWYQAYGGGEWWNHSHGEPFLLRSYAGNIEKLATLVDQILAGQEVAAPCMVDGDKEDLHNRRAKIQRLKASLKIQDYNPKRDFLGWGGEDFRRLQGMAGFTHISPVGRVDPEAQAISVIDFDGDGKQDLCLVGGSKVMLLQNTGEAMSESLLAGVSGARSAVWADYNGDGRPDLLLATPSGLKLFTNLGATMRDDSHLLPPMPPGAVTAAAWVDYDGDGRPDLLVAHGYNGLRLYRNTGLKFPVAPKMPKMTKWQHLGPLDNTRGTGFTTVHPAEKKIDLKAEYVGKDNLKIRWKEANFADGAINDLMQLYAQKTWAAVCLYREIEVDEDTSIAASFGSDDTLTVWLNGQKIISDPTYRACAPDQNLATLKLKAGKNQLLIKVCQGDGDWAFYFNLAQPAIKAPTGLAFEDVSEKVGLGPKGIGADLKGDSLTVCDVNGDGRPDFLYGAGKGILVMSAKNDKGEAIFVEAKDSGISFTPGKINPIFGDFDNDGHPDLLIPQKGGLKLFKNDGKGKFTDVTAKSGDLAKFTGWATSAAFGDVDNDGHLDIVVGCLKGSNRYYRNKGDGTFVDATEAIGLNQKIFNTQAVSLVDLQNRGVLDFIFNNEGQDSVVLLANRTQAGKRIPLTLTVGAKEGLTGSLIEIHDKDGKRVGSRHVCGGSGRGGQQAPTARFTLDPGTYRVNVRLSSGQVLTKNITLGNDALRTRIDGDAKAQASAK
jgi:FG-GAP-like repeat/FG-GAP repeat